MATTEHCTQAQGPFRVWDPVRCSGGRPREPGMSLPTGIPRGSGILMRRRVRSGENILRNSILNTQVAHVSNVTFDMVICCILGASSRCKEPLGS